MKPAPWAISQSIASFARALTDSRSRFFFCLAPIGDALVQACRETLGCRLAVSTASRWTCGSISGPETRRPAAIDHVAGLGRDPRLDGHDALALDGDVGRAHGLVLVRHERVLQNDVHARLSPM